MNMILKVLYSMALTNYKFNRSLDKTCIIHKKSPVLVKIDKNEYDSKPLLKLVHI